MVVGALTEWEISGEVEMAFSKAWVGGIVGRYGGDLRKEFLRMPSIVVSNMMWEETYETGPDPWAVEGVMWMTLSWAGLVTVMLRPIL